jgi:hypothetical protein
MESHNPNDQTNHSYSSKFDWSIEKRPNRGFAQKHEKHPLNLSIYRWPEKKNNAKKKDRHLTLSHGIFDSFDPFCFDFGDQAASRHDGRHDVFFFLGNLGILLLYMVTWIPSIYPSHVSINIEAPWILWVYHQKMNCIQGYSRRSIWFEFLVKLHDQFKKTWVQNMVPWIALTSAHPTRLCRKSSTNGPWFP